jgi:hypothetical protein
MSGRPGQRQQRNTGHWRADSLIRSPPAVRRVARYFSALGLVLLCSVCLLSAV